MIENYNNMSLGDFIDGCEYKNLRYLSPATGEQMVVDLINEDGRIVSIADEAGEDHPDDFIAAIRFHTDRDVEVTQYSGGDLLLTLQDTEGLARTFLFQPAQEAETRTSRKVKISDVLAEDKAGLIRVLPPMAGEGPLADILSLAYELKTRVGNYITLKPVNASVGGRKLGDIAFDGTQEVDLFDDVDGTGGKEFTALATTGFRYRVRFQAVPVQISDAYKPHVPAQQEEDRPVVQQMAPTAPAWPTLREVLENTCDWGIMLQDDMQNVSLEMAPDGSSATFAFVNTLVHKAEGSISVNTSQRIRPPQLLDNGVHTLQFVDTLNERYTLYFEKKAEQLAAPPEEIKLPELTLPVPPRPTLEEVLRDAHHVSLIVSGHKANAGQSFDVNITVNMAANMATFFPKNPALPVVLASTDQLVPPVIRIEGRQNKSMTGLLDINGEQWTLSFYREADIPEQLKQKAAQEQAAPANGREDSLFGIFVSAYRDRNRIQIISLTGEFEAEIADSTMDSVTLKAKNAQNTWTAKLDLRERAELTDRTDGGKAVMYQGEQFKPFRDSKGQPFGLILFPAQEQPAQAAAQPEAHKAEDKPVGIWAQAKSEGVEVLISEPHEVRFIAAPEGASHLRPFIQSEADYRLVVNFFRGMNTVNEPGASTSFVSAGVAPDLNKQLSSEQSRPKGVNPASMPLISLERLETSRARALAAPGNSLVRLSVAYSAARYSQKAFEQVLPHTLVLEVDENGLFFTRVVQDYHANYEEFQPSRYSLAMALSNLLQVAGEQQLTQGQQVSVRASEGWVVHDPEAQVEEHQQPARVAAAMMDVAITNPLVPLSRSRWATFIQRPGENKLTLSFYQLADAEGLSIEPGMRIAHEEILGAESIWQAALLILNFLKRDSRLKEADEQLRQATRPGTATSGDWKGGLTPSNRVPGLPDGWKKGEVIPPKGQRFTSNAIRPVVINPASEDKAPAATGERAGAVSADYRRAASYRDDDGIASFVHGPRADDQN